MGLFGERIGERIKPVTPCGAAGAGHGERILSSVKVFKSILSPGKARKIKPCAVLVKELKVFTPICGKTRKKGEKKKYKEVPEILSILSPTAAEQGKDTPAHAEKMQTAGQRCRGFLFPRREKNNFRKGVLNHEHSIKPVPAETETAASYD